MQYGNIRIETYVTNFSNPEINMQTIVNFVINFIMLSFSRLCGSLNPYQFAWFSYYFSTIPMLRSLKILVLRIPNYLICYFFSVIVAISFNVSSTLFTLHILKTSYSFASFKSLFPSLMKNVSCVTRT